MKKISLLLCFLAVAAAVMGQKQKADSILALAKNAEGMEKAKLIIYALPALREYNYDTALRYAGMAEKISAAEADSLAVFRAKYETGVIYSAMENDQKALEIHLGLLPMADDRIPLIDRAKLHYSLGVDYRYLREHEKAVQHLLKALDTEQEIRDGNPDPDNAIRLASALRLLGVVFSDIGNYEEAIRYYEKSLPYLEETHDEKSLAGTLMNIGTAYTHLGELDKSLDYYQQALPIYLAHDEAVDLTQLYFNMSTSYLENGEHRLALEYCRKALHHAQFSGLRRLTAICNTNLGRIWLTMNQPDSALAYLHRSIDIGKAMGDIQMVSSNYDYLSYYYKMKDDYKKALELKEEYIQVKDSIYNLEVSRQLAEMKEAYESEKKEQEIGLLTRDAEIKDLQIKRQQTLTWVLIAAVLLIVLVAVLLFGRMKQKQKLEKSELEKKNLETESKLLHAQINPHFIFNALNSIQSYISTREGLKAMTYLAKFSQLIRSILENSRKPMISLEDEINTLRLYIELEAMRFAGKFEFSIGVGEGLNLSRIYIPPMLVQPFVENSIKHGFRGLQRKGQLDISFSQSNGTLTCVVEDNGVGRRPAGEESRETGSGHVSLGLQVTRERLETLKNEKKVRAGYRIEDLTSEDQPAGTRVILTVPYESE